jgi:hypothetical protein
MLLHWQDEPDLQRYYVVDWRPNPNLATDLFAVWLGRIINLDDAGRILLSVSMAMWLFGTAVLHRALAGRYSIWTLAAIPFLFNMPLTLGSLNYYFGCGLLLFCLAAAVRVEGSRPAHRIAVLLAAALALYFSHLIALGIFAAAVALIDLERLIRLRARLREWIKAAAELALMMAAPVALLLAFAPPRYVAETSEESLVRWGGLVSRGKALWSAVFADLGYVDVIMLAAVTAFALLLACARMVRIDRRFRFLLPVFVLIALSIPVGIGKEDNVHYRMPAIVACIAVAAAIPRRERFKNVAYCAVGALAVVTAARHVVLIETWKDRDRDIAEFRQSVDLLPVGARVMPILAVRAKGPFRTPDEGDLAFGHLPEFAVMERGAYSPGFFAVPGQQPVQRTAEAAAISHGDIDPYRVGELDRTAMGSPEIGGWPTRYDYVITIGDAPDEISRFTGKPIVRGRRFGIYPVLR